MFRWTKSMTVGVVALNLCSPSLALAHGTEKKVIRPCQNAARVKGIFVKNVAAASAGDLPFVLITDKSNGASARIYYGPGLQSFARSNAVCWGAELRMLPPLIPDDRRNVIWDALAVVHDERYAPPRGETADRRWIIVVGAKARFSFDRFLLETMPHEEIHAVQRQKGAKLPRWFEEGHAQWAGLKVTDVVAADLSMAARSEARAKASAIAGFKLETWGGTRVKPEAILRQLTPEDRRRVKADPTFQPKGPFSFGPDDLTKDEDNTEGRYAAALLLFEGLEARHGKLAVLNWVDAVLASPPNVKALAVEKFGEDIGPLLK